MRVIVGVVDESSGLFAHTKKLQVDIESPNWRQFCFHEKAHLGIYHFLFCLSQLSRSSSDRVSYGRVSLLVTNKMDALYESVPFSKVPQSLRIGPHATSMPPINLVLGMNRAHHIQSAWCSNATKSSIGTGANQSAVI